MRLSVANAISLLAIGICLPCHAVRDAPLSLFGLFVRLNRPRRLRPRIAIRIPGSKGPTGSVWALFGHQIGTIATLHQGAHGH
ncbi:hypothetical protein [Chitinivorax sp. B]|uniref:hypothetical protein n=1 Tax=Chitinivorax sp. B TaxID=2502235 RepID=UPI0010F5A084|nr:hypothetical protein [Chitinivorax sp. B]